MERIGIYCRVSTDEQAQNPEGSIKNQKQDCARFVDAENLKANGNWGSVVEFYIDEGYSAKDLNRPAMKRLIFDCKSGKINRVVATCLTRVSRKVKNWIDLMSFFEDNEISLSILRQNFDTSSAMGRAMFNFAIQFAQLEREMTVERVTSSCRSRAERGLWIGGVVPFGLKKTERKGYLEVDTANQIIADDLLDILINEAGYATKAVELIKEKGYRKDDGQNWDEKSFCRWVRNKKLIGEVEVNKKNIKRDQSKLTEAEKYKVVPAVWEPVVAKEKWLKANEILDENYEKLKVPNWQHHEYVLTGLLKCPKGKELIGNSGWGRSGKKYVHYSHQKKHQGKCDCGIPTIPAEKIEKRVFARVKQLAKSPAVVDELVHKVNEEFQNKQPDFKKAIASNRQKLEAVVRKIEKTTDQVLDAQSEAEKNMWLEKSRRLHEQKDGIEGEIAEFMRRQHDQRSDVLSAAEVKGGLESFTKGFEDLPIASRRSLLTSILAGVQVKREKIVIRVKNPEFSLSGDRGLGCKPGGRFLGHQENWLRRRDSNPRQGG